jgi:hypothetical protein
MFVTELCQVGRMSNGGKPRATRFSKWCAVIWQLRHHCTHGSGRYYTSLVAQRHCASASGGERTGEWGAHRRNNNDTKQSSVSINMFAGTKVKTIGAPTVWDFANVLWSILDYKSDNHERSCSSNNKNRTVHTQHGKVLDRVCEVTFQIVFYTWPNHIFVTQQERSMLFSGNTGHWRKSLPRQGEV